MAKQEELNAISYPPAHTYNLGWDVQPTGVLKIRFDRFQKTIPEFFASGSRFLDVGCSKGFYSIIGSKVFETVVGIDMYEEYGLNFCKSLEIKNAFFTKSTFRDFTSREKFDRIFLGNVHHYIFNQCFGTWDWVRKLAVLSSNLVVIEGPITWQCADMVGTIPVLYRKNFTPEKFLVEMDQYFQLLANVPCEEQPGRNFLVFRRKKDGFSNRFSIEDFPILQGNISERTHFETEVDNKHCIVKCYPQSFLPDAIDIARLAPLSNGIEGVIYDKSGQNIIGWLCPFLQGRVLTSNKDIFEEDMLKAFKAWCLHERFFFRVGYVDGDAVPFNFMEVDGKVVMFDKHLVYPQSQFDEDRLPYLLKVFSDNFGNIGKDNSIVSVLKAALLSKDALLIEQTFSMLLHDME